MPRNLRSFEDRAPVVILEGFYIAGQGLEGYLQALEYVAGLPPA